MLFIVEVCEERQVTNNIKVIVTGDLSLTKVGNLSCQVVAETFFFYFLPSFRILMSDSNYVHSLNLITLLCICSVL